MKKGEACLLLSCGRIGFRYLKMGIDHFFLFCALMSLLALPPIPSAFSQTLPNSDPSGRSGNRDRLPDIPEQKTPAEIPLKILPPPVHSEEPAGSLPMSVYARKIVVTGSTVFTAEEIAKVTRSYENRNVTMEDLELLRRELTLLYINKGYINSGAVIPDQTVTNGLITVQVVEGKLTHIDLEGNKWFRDSFLRDRIALGAQTPLDVHSLQDRLQRLQQDERIQRIQAELRPGAKPGESELKVNVEEKTPYYAWLAFNNYQSPSVGAERGLITLMHQNLSGRGDTLSLTYGGSRGLNPLIDAWYAIPINVHDTSLQFRYRKNDFGVVDTTFGPLDIVSRSESFEITLLQPVYRTLDQEFSLALSFEHETNKTSLLGEPFSFSPGEVNGKSNVVPLRFLQEWTYRTQRQVFAVRSRFSFGLNAMDATTNADKKIPDGQFFSWLGQFQWTRLIDLLDAQLLFRTDLQLSNQPLLPIEQIGVGGRYSVRGYRENLLVRDQAFITSLEARVPIVQNKRWADYLQLCPFIDYGRATNKDLTTPSPKDISSIGLGLRWSALGIKSPLTLKPDIEFYWGQPLRHIDQRHEELQDSGIHFQIALTGYW
jgi:hemolysin activation/secretion protein